jgi:hypothetical protein
MQRAKAILIPSLWDTFNLVTAEAMALGKVVVVSDGAGAAGLIESGVNGFTFPSGDAVALAETVRHVEGLTEADRGAIGWRAARTANTVLNPVAHAREKIRLLNAAPSPSDADESSWIGDLLFPATPYRPLEFLDALPLKATVLYTMRRLRAKLLGMLP